MNMPNEHDHRLSRALVSFEGLSVGDGFGQQFFADPETVENRLTRRELPPAPWPVTDDSMMARAIVQNLRSFGRIDQDGLAQAFAEEYARDHRRGYGGTAHGILRAIGSGTPWLQAAAAVFEGQGSCGNGGAMRAAPVGAYFADDPNRVCSEARASAEVTHAHPDGQTGAIAVALAAAWIASQAFRRLQPTVDMMVFVLEHLPKTETFIGVKKALDLSLKLSPVTAAFALGNGSGVIASDTVPFCLWCASRHLDDFVEAMWTTVAGFGDRDTNCAIVGGLVALSVGREGIPEDWLAARESLTV